MKKVAQIIWLIAGVLACVVLGLVINLSIEAKQSLQDVTDVFSQVTIDDLRHGLSLIDQQLENNKRALELEERLSIVPLPDTAEIREAFKDFCGRTGYVYSNPENYLAFRYGRLKP